MMNPITCIPHFLALYHQIFQMKWNALHWQWLTHNSGWSPDSMETLITQKHFPPYLYVCLSFVYAPPKFLQLTTAIGEDCYDAGNCPSLNKSARTWITAKNLFSFFKTCLDFASSLIHRKSKLLANELHLRWICIIYTFFRKMGRIEQLRQDTWAVFSYTRSFSNVICMAT